MKRIGIVCLALALVGLGLALPSNDAQAVGRRNKQTQVNVVTPAGVPEQITVQQHGRRQTQVSVSNGFAPQVTTVQQSGFRGRRESVTQVNLAPAGGGCAGFNAGLNNGAFINNQVLVDRNFRRAQIVDVNSFTLPQNTPANIRFRGNGAVVLTQPPIVSTPIIEQVTVQQPATVVQQQTTTTTAPQGVPGGPQCPLPQTQVPNQVQGYLPGAPAEQVTTTTTTTQPACPQGLAAVAGACTTQRFLLSQNSCLCRNPQALLLQPAQVEVDVRKRGLFGRRTQTSVNFR